MIPSATKISITVQSVGDQANCSVKWTMTILICDLSPDKNCQNYSVSNPTFNTFKCYSILLFSNWFLTLSLIFKPKPLHFTTRTLTTDQLSQLCDPQPKWILNNFYFLNLSTFALLPLRTCCSDQAHFLAYLSMCMYTHPYKGYGRTGNVKVVFCTRSLHKVASWESVQPVTKLCTVHNN